MKTAIYGRIRASDIDDADLFAGITPTSFLHVDGNQLPPAELGLPAETIELSTMMDHELATKQAEARLITHSEALIIRGDHPTLADRARRMGSLVYEVA
jgi:hypothetical protein